MWTYKNKEIKCHEDLEPNCTDIVYQITYVSGKKYIGKKNVRAMRRLKATKAQKAVRKNYKRVELKNIPFVNYEGSSKETEGQLIESKEILLQCSDRRTATYIEAGCLFEVDAIFNKEYLNKNILGSFFDNALNGVID